MQYGQKGLVGKWQGQRQRSQVTRTTWSMRKSLWFWTREPWVWILVLPPPFLCGLTHVLLPTGWWLLCRKWSHFLLGFLGANTKMVFYSRVLNRLWEGWQWATSLITDKGSWRCGFNLYWVVLLIILEMWGLGYNSPQHLTPRALGWNDFIWEVSQSFLSIRFWIFWKSA